MLSVALESFQNQPGIQIVDVHTERESDVDRHQIV